MSFQDLKDGLSQKMSSIKGKDKDFENPSMAEGINDKAYGIKRSVVYGIVLFVVCAFLGFSYMSMGDDEDKAKGKKETEEAADAKNMMNTDRQLQAMNNKAKNPNGVSPNGAPPMEGGKANNNTAQNNSQMQPHPAGQEPSQYPAIPRRNQGNYSNPYPLPMLANAPAEAPKAEAKESEASRLGKEKAEFGAAIAFDGGYGNGSRRSSENTPAQEAVEGSVPAGNREQPGSGSSLYGNAGVYGNMPLSAAAAYMEPTANCLQAGTVIPAVLLTGINTDVGGQVLAQIETDVYDSLTGNCLLIPAGSRLVGTVAQGAQEGQNRVAVNWQTLMLPTGGSYALGGSMVAADLAGYGGIPGRIHHHSSGLLRGGLFTSVVAALGSMAAGNTSTTANTYTAGQLAAQGAMSNLMNTASALIQKGVDSSRPTVTVAAGSEFMVYVTRPVQLNAY
ncbi:TrbI/VirB10 family protein [Selenomonas sp. KH1T6]|uniref:TrbI/VirB10 family protein n=1 Tax=Selenomonas sp. KH1T6 TaxID=3158784 RepID=UPI0008A79A01|nr:type IV secretion system protein VirB10 [Selenomonas ruminantium]